MKLPPLKTLPVFETVARLSSFSRAAEALNISQSAVSHQIRQLEDYLGEPLFLRTGRQIRLTEEGNQYFEQISSALSQIERASEQLQGNEDTQLRLAVYSSFAVSWLIPRLPRLQRLHPQLDLDLEMLSELPRMSDRMGDCFIAINPKQRGFSSELLYSERMFPVCSRQYWQQMVDDLGQAGLLDEGPPEKLNTGWIQRYTLLSATSIFEKKNEDWRRWLAVEGETVHGTTRVQHFSHMIMAHEAARHHQGIALSNDYMFDPEDPILVRLPCHILNTGDEFHFAYKTSRRNEAAIRLLKQWLIQEAIRSGLRGEG
ncbi:DNA-binding transcriptional LysR family regulator [Natronospira proteinivora]|uniref:DNA-binding transcriptional LysR family regulator n=1 Tax=Natronospira proteinivora TaxID=1807133 RepID=A0ABT1G7B8_9GAMM|nr:LysR family transcriptional regulator [Natronospira proteinivora]MCP1727199.1 DNA-binding transcriptional LysR family regulator [Natronospira proteinivora]